MSTEEYSPEVFSLTEESLSFLGDVEKKEHSPPHHRIKKLLIWTKNRVPKIEYGIKSLGYLFTAIVPSFVYSLAHPSVNSSATTLRPSAALDGIRGLACLGVMNYHILYVYQSFVFYGYGVSSQDVLTCGRPEDSANTNLWWHQLPIFRLSYSGTAPVAIFFVISGFALSYKPLSLAQQGQRTSASHNIASSTLRRAIRLFLPTTLFSFIVMLAVYFGLWEESRKLVTDGSFMTGYPEHHTERFFSYWAQFWHWSQNTFWLTRVYTWNEFHSRYDVHLWTIPVEFRASMVLFVVLPVYINLRRPLRYYAHTFLLLYTYLWNRWDVLLFLSGQLIADTSQIWHDRGKSLSDRPRFSRQTPYLKWLWPASRLILVVVSLHLLSAPDFCMGETPGFRTLSIFIPPTDHQPFRFLPSIGAFLLIALTAHSDSSFFINRFFNSDVLQYLGKISYSLYIVHGPVIHSFGYLCFNYMWTRTGKEVVWRYCVGFGCGYFVTVIAIIWVADITWRGIDTRCVKLARWLDAKLLDSIQ